MLSRYQVRIYLDGSVRTGYMDALNHAESPQFRDVCATNGLPGTKRFARVQRRRHLVSLTGLRGIVSRAGGD